MSSITMRPDSRGRLALGKLVDRDRDYIVDRDPDGTITLAPVALVLSDDAYRDMLADPEAFARRIAAAQAARDGAETVTLEEHLATIE